MAMSVSSKRITGILAAIEEVIAHGPKTPDMKGNATTPQVADAICKIILR
ncbi:tartrate dehydrogenase/decarboxylase (D-malate dehydrogenase [decarboxylating]) [Escherichia coli]|uniref:Tartrate dehydrogenase/decarboxylase (D-malate dehydrogenase [decarboxylating]) n=1 Tax=Escherichia coli TaxID=562 RepID=A0A2X1K6G7_ECOLX|nr:tartrate dehydrogenase/decarboxylase (D-malate dehydrogenase [decarboxylating]) [Escherichia coli]